MNLLLIRPGELDERGTAVLCGRRAQHLREVLDVAVGQVVRAGLVDGPLGRAEVIDRSAARVTLRCTFDVGAAPPPGRDVLLLAVPRPKVLRRTLGHAAALGYGTVVLFRSWRVDKSHLQSRALDPAALEAGLLDGLEQAGRTRVPRVLRFDRFKPFVEDRLEGLLAAIPARYVATPDASRHCADAAWNDAGAGRARGAAFALAVGPERGLTGYEIEAFAARGFAPVRLAGTDGALRVEAAVVALTAQLLLRRAVAGHSRNSGLSRHRSR